MTVFLSDARKEIQLGGDRTLQHKRCSYWSPNGHHQGKVILEEMHLQISRRYTKDSRPVHLYIIYSWNRSDISVEVNVLQTLRGAIWHTN